LEPSVGDGAFIDSINGIENNLSIKLSALDISSDELSKASEKWNRKKNKI